MRQLDIKDVKYNSLTPIRIAEKRNGRNYWECKCDCGNITRPIIVSSIIRGDTKSCGCLWENTVRKGFGEISGEYWSVCIKGAKSRNINFNLSIDDAWELFLNQDRKCLLTGRELNFTTNLRKENRDKHTASLDRIDSNGIYEIKNVCWLHKEINKLKNDFHTNDFIKLCNEVAKRNPV